MNIKLGSPDSGLGSHENLSDEERIRNELTCFWSRSIVCFI